MADSYQNEISKMLHGYNIFTRHERALPVIKYDKLVGWNTPDRSSPDLTGGLVHQINVEVKTGKNERFNFSSWDDGQREYAAEWRIKRGCEYWLAIITETKNSPHRVKRVAALVPYPIMIRTEEVFSGIQKSIPFKAVKGMNLHVQENNLCMEQLWAEFMLNWIPGHGWSLPEEHAFFKMYLNQKPYLYTEVSE